MSTARTFEKWETMVAWFRSRIFFVFAAAVESLPVKERGNLQPGWSYLNFNGVNTQAGILNDLSLGVNWYLNPYTRVSFNYIHAMLDNPIKGQSEANCFGVRFQVDFGSPPVPAARRQRDSSQVYWQTILGRITDCRRWIWQAGKALC